MNEIESRAWVATRFGDAAVATLAALIDLVRDEASRQNLIAPSTLEAIWSRHVVDSVQLIDLADRNGTWLDIGTGGGFPGLAVAALRPERTILVEPRRLRAAFLAEAAERLALPHVEVVTAKVEAVTTAASVISARAVGPVEKILHAAAGCATTTTRWLLPRGQLIEGELGALRRRWIGEFHVKQSLTDPMSSILVVDGVALRR